MAYEPKNKKGINLKIAILIGVAFLIVAFIGVKLFPNNPKTNNDFNICGYKYDKTKEIIEKEYVETYAISDYLYYGESLNLYQNPYNVESIDEISGKSILIKDLCSDKEYAFVAGANVDRQILLNTIDEGYYELYVVENLIEKRMVFTSEVKSPITTIARKGKRKEVTLLANQNHFKEKGIDEDKNYIYLDVKKTSIEKDKYDIVLDPAANDYDFTSTLYKGSEGNDLIEYKESYKAASLLKTALENKGLKVLITREEDEKINSYGSEGRLERAYKANAKYYIRLGFGETEFKYNGMDITYSAHSSNMFANQIIYYLKRNIPMEISNVFVVGEEEGIVQATPIKGLDNRVVYDNDLWIREAGGRATLAGTYSENAVNGTAFFAKDNLYGMNALNINLGYLTSEKDVEYWNQEQESYMNALAHAMAVYLDIEE